MSRERICAISTVLSKELLLDRIYDGEDGTLVHEYMGTTKCANTRCQPPSINDDIAKSRQESIATRPMWSREKSQGHGGDTMKQHDVFRL